MEVYPELTPNHFINGTIVLQDDADGSGAYIAAWNYEKPIPQGMKLGKDEVNKL
jgi:hypothetical protein